MTSDQKNLSQQKCQPCEGNTQPLSREEARKYMEQLTDWQLSDDQPLTISKTYEHSNFTDALAAANQIGEIAEAEDHHPDLHLHDYKKLSVNLTTHAIGGLSENDFILAAKIDETLAR